MKALMNAAVGIVVGILIAAAAAPASAQGSTWSMSDKYSATSPSASFQTPNYTPTPHSAIEHHASTYFEGAARGVASIMKAYADGMLSLSQARILMAEAHAREMQNEVIKTETFLARQKALKEDFRERTLRKWEWLETAREHRAERERSVMLEAYHVPAKQLNRLTGEITWPVALTHPCLAEYRNDLQAVMTRVASHGPEYARSYGDSVAHSVEEFRNFFRIHREQLGVDDRDYFEAQSFLVGIKYEAQFWGAGDRLAMVASR